MVMHPVGRFMDPVAARAYVRRWVETGELLEKIRWSELAALDAVSALRATDMLIDLALRVPLPTERFTRSGLTALQDRLHRRT